jgi:hypothetical protein
MSRVSSYQMAREKEIHVLARRPWQSLFSIPGKRQICVCVTSPMWLADAPLRRYPPLAL